MSAELWKLLGILANQLMRYFAFLLLFSTTLAIALNHFYDLKVIRRKLINSSVQGLVKRF